MTVKELKEKLEYLDPEIEVLVDLEYQRYTSVADVFVSEVVRPRPGGDDEWVVGGGNGEEECKTALIISNTTC